MASFEQVMAYHKSVIDGVIRNQVSMYLVDIWLHYYNMTVYSEPEGDNYQRSFAAYDATRATVDLTGDKYIIELFSDPSWMTYAYPSMFVDTNGSVDNRENIINWLNYGTNSKIFSHPKHNFIGLTEKEISQKLNMFFIKELRKHGIKAKSRGLTQIL